MTRRFEFVGGNSAKFWSINVAGNNVTVTYGRLSTAGQQQTKTFPSADSASRQVENLVHKKLAKGYIECAPV